VHPRPRQLALQGPAVSSRRFQPAGGSRAVQNRATPTGLTAVVGPSGAEILRAFPSVGFIRRLTDYSRYPASRDAHGAARAAKTAGTGTKIAVNYMFFSELNGAKQ
jgi:hypothetical protein